MSGRKKERLLGRDISNEFIVLELLLGILN